MSCSDRKTRLPYQIYDSRLVLLAVGLGLTAGTSGSEPSRGAFGLSFSPENEHQDVPWF